MLLHPCAIYIWDWKKHSLYLNIGSWEPSDITKMQRYTIAVNMHVYSFSSKMCSCVCMRWHEPKDSRALFHCKVFAVKVRLCWCIFRCFTPQTKGTSSFGKRHNKSHTLCVRCGRKAYHIQKKTCAQCGYPAARIRKCMYSQLVENSTLKHGMLNRWQSIIENPIDQSMPIDKISQLILIGIGQSMTNW